METLMYKTVDGSAIKLDVRVNPSAAHAAAIVWIHGGALISGRRSDAGLANSPLGDLCAQAGYAQFSIDYRLAPETKLPEIVADLQDAIGWIRAEGPRRWGIDATRLAAIGRSAGGYLALMAGFCVVPRPRALVSFFGYGDISGAWYSQPDAFYRQERLVTRAEALAAVGITPVSELPAHHARRTFYLYCRQNGRWPSEVMGLDPVAHPRAFDPYCPIRNLDARYPPTLLLHGTADTDVPYRQSVDMAEALRRQGVPHELVTIPGGPHGFDAHVSAADLTSPAPAPAAQSFHTVLAFLARHA